MSAIKRTSFAPLLYIAGGMNDISFYEKAFGAEELRRWTNDDVSIHVAELSIEGAKALVNLVRRVSMQQLF
ncbi:MAG: hypothetical protein WKI04_09355 [Ferruginibacter sp.]